MPPIYKICAEGLWREAERKGEFTGAAIDLVDGYIHFSSGDQVRETAERHFSDERDLLLIAVDPTPLRENLRWEKSRGGALFPHLYAALPISAVVSVTPLPLGADGKHSFPAHIP